MKYFSSITAAAIAAAASLIAAGCSKPIAGPSEPLIHTPKAGSTFLFHTYAKDTLGKEDPATDTVSARIVTSTNATVAGKTGVIQYKEAADTLSMHFEDNGDVSNLIPAITFPGNQAPPTPQTPSFSFPARWAVLPYGSKTPQTVPPIDTTVSFPVQGVPLAIPVKGSGTSTYVGTEDLTVGSEKIGTQKAFVTYNVGFTIPFVGDGKITISDTLWFSPKLGMFVKDDGLTTAQYPQGLGRSGIQGGSFSILTSYVIP
ncbi:MAG: hypothetical protein JST22_18250 [Bacteroidetes bacterium]|nr:hypothetical protein [Bacteroidota bacterium]